ncbi:MAG: hypothetical protein E7331_01415 [Clostridiales bacterium]|nr:hypothetical protein [Clostridiales bacterium]
MTEAERSIWGKTIISKALEYANYRWYPTEKHLFHGIDSMGRYVDTPDTTWTGETLHCGWWKPNQWNIGIPYGWGNGSTLEAFAKGLTEGKYAGNVPEDTSRYGSHCTVGVDCSGLLTVLWELPKKIATRDIPLFADVLDDLTRIRPGDVLAKPGSHVMFFMDFTAADMKRAIIVDSTRSTGKVSQREADLGQLFSEGYQIFRKKE